VDKIKNFVKREENIIGGVGVGCLPPLYLSPCLSTTPTAGIADLLGSKRNT